MNAPLWIVYLAVCAMQLALAGGYASRFAREEGRVSPQIHAAQLATILSHTAFLALLGLNYHEIPLVSWANMASWIALGLAIVHTTTEARFHTGGTGVFIFALAFALQMAAWPSLGMQPEPNRLLQNPIYGVHVGWALLGYVGFLISTLYGLLYLVLYRMLKERRFGAFVEGMPPLDLMARMNLHAAAVGFLCLTLSLALGVELSWRLNVAFLHDAKFIQSMCAWLLYGLLLVARYALGWKGRLQVAVSVACFGALALSAAAVHLFFTTFHHFT